MLEFFLAFGLLMAVMVGMALGVILSGRTIKGSCGGSVMQTIVWSAKKRLTQTVRCGTDLPARARAKCLKAQDLIQRHRLADVYRYKC
jgi:hypothetical protein